MRIKAIRPTLLQERVLWAREVETIVTIRSLEPSAGPPLHNKRMPWPGSVLVEIETDEGAVGVGLGGGGWPGAFCVEHYLAPLLIDENPLDIERLCRITAANLAKMISFRDRVVARSRCQWTAPGS